MSEPRTKAGRNLVAFFGNLNEGDQFSLREFALAIEAEAAAVPGALSEMRVNAAARRVAGAATALNKVATWSALNRPETPSLLDAIAEWERVWDGSDAAEPGALREALDVERLARALHDIGLGCMTGGPLRPCQPSDRRYADFHPAAAKSLADEYAALSREEATSE